MTAPAASASRTGSSTDGRLLEVEKLSVRYERTPALSDVSFSVGTGEVVAVLGVNGAGKSSLARALCGLVPASAGSVRFDGERITGRPPHQIRRAGLVYLPEGRGVFPGLSVAENLRMASATLARGARKSAEERAYELFPALARRRRQTAAQLSGGEQQMLSLARALVVSPKLVIADEMSLGLAPQMVDLVFESLGRARDAGVAVVLIEQFVHRALGFADRAVVLQRGRLVWAGSAAAAGDQALTGYLGGGTAA